jgi:hypothetical protein
MESLLKTLKDEIKKEDNRKLKETIEEIENSIYI